MRILQLTRIDPALVFSHHYVGVYYDGCSLAITGEPISHDPNFKGPVSARKR